MGGCLSCFNCIKPKGTKQRDIDKSKSKDNTDKIYKKVSLKYVEDIEKNCINYATLLQDVDNKGTEYGTEPADNMIVEDVKENMPDPANDDGCDKGKSEISMAPDVDDGTVLHRTSSCTALKHYQCSTDQDGNVECATPSPSRPTTPTLGTANPNVIVIPGTKRHSIISGSFILNDSDEEKLMEVLKIRRMTDATSHVTSADDLLFPHNKINELQSPPSPQPTPAQGMVESDDKVLDLQTIVQLRQKMEDMCERGPSTEDLQLSTIYTSNKSKETPNPTLADERFEERHSPMNIIGENEWSSKPNKGTEERS